MSEKDNIKEPWKKTMNLDQALSTPARIAILLFLLPRGSAKFSIIQNAVGLSAGNLSSHLKQLESSDYIIIEKKFVENRPTTIIEISSKGQKNIMNYIRILKSALNE